MKSVKFTHAEDGGLTFDQMTALGSLMQLGALAHTADRRSPTVGFATDLDGLEAAHETAGSASVSLACHVQTIAKLMVDEDSNVEPEVWRDMGWMLAAFGRQLLDLHNLQADLSEAIEAAKADKQKAAKKGGAQ